MKKIILIFLMSSIVFACVSSGVNPKIDYRKEYSFTLLLENIEVSPKEEEARGVKQIIGNWIYEMKKPSLTYPSPKYTLKISGVDEQGNKIEEYIFIGTNWLGNGVGLSTLADTQIFRLHQLLEKVKNR